MFLDRFLIWLGSKSRKLWHGSFIYRLDSLLINCRSFRVRRRPCFCQTLLNVTVVLGKTSVILKFTNKWKSLKTVYKHLCDKFPIKKSILTIFQYFPCSLSRCRSFLPHQPVCGYIFGCKMGNIHFFHKNKNLSKHFAKISVTKFHK